jgi:hypothetical protein
LFWVAPLRLCIFALKVFCLVAVCKDWPSARSGAKGQGPTQGRVGVGFWKLVLTLALTFYPLPQERRSPLDGSGFLFQSAPRSRDRGDRGLPNWRSRKCFVAHFRKPANFSRVAEW